MTVYTAGEATQVYDRIFIPALCIWREARSESLQGQIAVYSVLKNRANDSLDRWPKTLSGVGLQARQFSCFNPEDKQAHKLPRFDDLLWLHALTIVMDDPPDNTDGANHYYADYLPEEPKWASAMERTVKIGVHIFLRG